MRYSVAVSALALATAVFAQDPIIIHVGNNGTGGNGLFFSPNSVTASNGTVVTFVFDTSGTNHTVSQSTFPKPCEPAPGGFDSGYTPGPANANDPPAMWNLTITNDAKPIWFYCAQEKRTHCIAGMVGAINAPAPPAPNNLDAFVSNAIAALTIAQPTPALSGIGAFASAAPTILVSSAAPSAGTTVTASVSSSPSATASGSASVAPDSTSTPSPTTTQGNTDTTSPSSASAAPGTTTDNGAVVTTTMTSSATSSSAPASTSNAAAAGAGAVGTNGLVWAVAAVFGAALL